MAHHDIFRHHLAIKYPAYGCALWEPSPGGRYPAVAVGDVGFVREGRFHRLFNVLLSPNDPSHRIFGVPNSEEDEQLRPHVEDHIITGTLSPNHLCSAGVALEPESEIFANEPKSSTGVSFSCRRKQGAVLSFPIQARCEDTVALGDFGKWMVKHIDRWFSWVRELGVGISRKEDIVPATGAHLARSWTNVAFLEGQANARVSLEVQVAADASINWHVSPDRNDVGAVFNDGPNGKDLPEDQCIFIRGFRVTRKLMILPRTLKGAAGPNPDSKGSDSEPDLELIPIPTVPEYRDPLHILLEYIAESAPDDCDIVLVHDDDLVVLLDGFDDDSSLDTLQPVAVETHLQCSKPEIREVRYLPDLSSGRKDENIDTEIVRAAILSGSRIFEEHSLLPSPTSSGVVARTNTLPSSSPDRLKSNYTFPHLHSRPTFMANTQTNDVLSWTSQDPRQSTLYSQWGTVVYQFQTETNSTGHRVTVLWRLIRANKEDRVAKLEWAPNGGLGRAVIGNIVLPMADLVRRDTRMLNSRIFNGPDGLMYRWRPSTTNRDICLLDPKNNVIAFIRITRPTRYQIGDVYAELHFLRSAGTGVVMHAPLMNMVTVTAMLYRVATASNLE